MNDLSQARKPALDGLDSDVAGGKPFEPCEARRSEHLDLGAALMTGVLHPKCGKGFWHYGPRLTAEQKAEMWSAKA